jgi:hypothetical protein
MVERRRTLNLNVRIDEAEAKMLKALADLRGLSASDVVRQFIREAYAEAFPPRKPRR